MLKKQTFSRLLILVCLLQAHSVLAEPNKGSAKIITKVNINGEDVDAYFNDGDTFKILSGPQKNTRVRIAGFNTLESYGPVHEWSGNTPEYLLENANLATKMARTGPWNCSAKKERDTYGRLLATCSDLAIALIENGLAHAFSVDSSPASRTYLRYQRLAQKAKLGMWKNGVPEYVITSLHSIDERKNQRKTYNRLISTEYGNTKTWSHNSSYETCEKVCIKDTDSCMTYVPYRIRYGNNRPDCLKLGK